MGRHLPQAHKLQLTAGKEEHIAGLEPADEGLFHMAEHGAAHKAHRDGPIGGDGADVQAMHSGDRLFLHQIEIALALELAVARIGTKAVAAVLEEAQAPLPVAIAELAVAPGGADRCQGLGRFESRAAGQAGEVLQQHVDRCRRWLARLHQPLA